MITELGLNKVGEKPKLFKSSANRGGQILQELLGLVVPVFPDKIDLEISWNRLMSYVHLGVRRELDFSLPLVLKLASPTSVGTYTQRYNTLWTYWGFNPQDILMTEAHETMHAYFRQTSKDLHPISAYVNNEGLAT